MSTSPVDSAHRLTPRPTPPDQGDTRTDFRRWLEDSSIPTVLAATAFGGSYGHLVTLVHRSGLPGPEGYVTAACIDAIIAMAARERQRDKRTKRRTGKVSYPFLVMVGGTLLSLAGQLATAQHSGWGFISAAIPLVAFLLALGIIERRSAESHRQAAAYATELAAWETAESERLAAIERQDRERQEELERQRLEDDRQRQAELTRESNRQARIREAQQRAALIANGTANAAAIGNGDRPAIEGVAVITDAPAINATTVMRAYWDAEVSKGRVPSGAELGRVAGVPETSSLGRTRRREWLPELSAEMISSGAA